MSDLIRRRDATEKTLKKFKNKDFTWQGVTCAHLFRTHAVNMGHKMPAMPRIQSVMGAKRALKKIGCENMNEVMKYYGFTEIAPAQMLIGDIGVTDSDDGFGSIVINAGHKYIGWHDDGEQGLQNIIIDKFAGTWRL